MSNAFNSINGAGWLETTNVDFLKDIRNPVLGNRHVPVNHGDVLDMFHLKGAEQGMSFGESSGYLSPEQDKFIYVVESEVTPEQSYAIGFINFNDRSRSFVGLAGEKVFVCSNMCFGGVFAPSRTRHTVNVEDRLDEKVNNIFEGYQTYVNAMRDEQEFLRNKAIDDAKLGQVLVELHRSKIMGATNVQRVVEEFDKPTFNDNDEPSNGWRLQNAFTHVLKKIKNPIQNIDTGNAGRKIVLNALGY
jgi:hypothetical protein